MNEKEKKAIIREPKVVIEKVSESAIREKVTSPVMAEQALSYMTKITQQQLQDFGYYFVKKYEKKDGYTKVVSKIELKQYHPETIQYGKNGRKYIPLPDEFLLTEEEAVRGEGNPRLYQSDSFQKAATYILYQIYYGNITPYGYTYDKAKQRVKKLEM